MNFHPVKINYLTILRISCFCLFLGRAWQHFFWDIPIRSVLWDEELLASIVTSLTGMSWPDYVSSSGVEFLFKAVQFTFGGFYLFLAVLSLFIKETHRKLGKLFLVGTVFLFCLVLLYFKAKFYYIGMLIEHALQVGTGAIFYYALFEPDKFQKKIVLIKILIALTFIGHGLFAVGFHPVPGHFIDMLINVFGVNEDTAMNILLLAGSLDFFTSILLFYPKTAMYALVFNIFWGLATASARIIAHIDLDLIEFTSHQWVHETLYRIPHGLIPLALFIYLLKAKKEKIAKTIS